jgi:hypothetical protein
MRFMMIVKADKDTEAGALPRKADLEAMGQYNEALQKAGVMVDGVGLQASSKGARVAFVEGKPQVTDGPFPETKELIAGFWMLEVESKAEAIEWAKKVPFRHLPGSGRIPELELRQVFGEDDFADLK